MFGDIFLRVSWFYRLGPSFFLGRFEPIYSQNAYVVHQAGSNDTPPLVGLLGTTNITEAAQKFQSDRGGDLITSAALSQASLPGHEDSRPKAGSVYAASFVSAFVGAAGLAALFRWHRERSSGSRSMASGRPGKKWWW